MEPSVHDREIPFFALPFNAFCDLLSGADWLEASTYWSMERKDKEAHAALPILENRFASPNQFLFASSHAPCPLEVFWLKWKLFACICERLYTIHRFQRRPYLGLYPDRLHALIPDVWDGISPARWNFWVRLPEPQGAQEFKPADVLPEFNQPLFLPFHSVTNTFQASEIKEWPLEKEESVTVLIKNMERIVNKPDGPLHQAQGLLQLHVLSDTSNFSSFTPKDLLCIHLIGIEGGEEYITIWGTMKEPTERGMLVEGRTDFMPIAQWEHLDASRKQPFMRTPMVIYRRYHIPSDLYSLGRLLFHILLDRNPASTGRLDIALPRMIASLEGQVLSAMNRADDETLGAALLQRERILFSKDSIVFPSKRTISRRIPDELWFAALSLGLRLMVRKSGVGIAAHAGDYDEHNLQQAMSEVLTKVQALGREIQLELFGHAQRNRDILQACHILGNELLQKKGALGAL